jgi:protein translocase SecG subunit
MNNTIFTVAQLTISIVLIITILMQNKGADLSQVFGGNDSYSYRTKRGIEKVLSRATVVLVSLLIGISIATIIMN